MASLIEEYHELHRLSEKLDDEYFDKALEKALQFIKDPSEAAKNASGQILALQSISFVFSLRKIYYQTLGNKLPDAAMKKNLYYSAQASLDRLVDALKYMVK